MKTILEVKIVNTERNGRCIKVKGELAHMVLNQLPTKKNWLVKKNQSNKVYLFSLKEKLNVETAINHILSDKNIKKMIKEELKNKNSDDTFISELSKFYKERIIIK